MKLYLSSFRLGNKPEQLANLLSHTKKAAIIVNAIDDATESLRVEKLRKEQQDLQNIGIFSEEID